MRIGGVSGLTMLVEAAFGYDAIDPAPAWTNITTYVRGFNTRRGRKREIDRVTAGSCTILLDNRDRRFEGGYTGGAYGSNVVPMVPIRIRVTRNAVTYPVFYGYADEWVPTLDAKNHADAVVMLRATDAFKVLAMVPLSRSMWEKEVVSDSPVAWYRMGETIDDGRMLDQSGNGYDGAYVNDPAQTSGLVTYDHNGARAFDGISQYAQVIDPRVLTAGAMSLEVWFQPGRVDGGAQSASVVRQLSSGGDQWELRAGAPDPDRNLVNFGFFHSTGGTLFSEDFAVGRYHLVCTAGTGTSTIYINKFLADTSSSAVVVDPSAMEGIVIGRRGVGLDELAYFWLNGTVDEVAIYDTILTSQQVTDHYDAAVAPRDLELSGARVEWLLDQAAWPGVLRDLDVGQSTLGPARLDSRSVIDLLMEAVDYEDGDLFAARDGSVTFRQRTARYVDTTATTSQATFTYAGSNGSYAGLSFDYSDELLKNHAKITSASGVTYEAEDATSIDKYFRRTHEQRAPQTDANSAQALAQWIVQKRKDPRRRITALKVPATRNTATFDRVVGLELGHRITVALDPPGAGTISEDAMVEGIDHDVTPNSWTTTLWCSPEPTPDIFIVGVSLVGGSEVLGY
jgi:hypothetical protein